MSIKDVTVSEAVVNKDDDGVEWVRATDTHWNDLQIYYQIKGMAWMVYSMLPFV